ncbi:O-linked N-acetylglucosamine transferase, SPINDLY family protein [Anabaena sphaerica FACHB-251]|uniref:O-linked N-acetylglucosamine transferase, SPINDLY family protein n=1 Tax=Anabaena sphaerica FACHB-251 TaxID=2692883 RepID=A0A926WJ14_9NOST|nr:O-linked N-acetylglucosamine transferase, SPINDLY family protein [Anabaena sphaerica]MBD2295332.1 O-linked N-acetylglucosamine transferase, SPINDLY family protein [Anabaena sphaerica FACHB-251]
MEKLTDWQQKAEQYLLAADYIAAARIYEEAIKQEPESRINYWYLGLMLLLQGQETEAQLTWFSILAEAEEEEYKIYFTELLEILFKESERQFDITEYHISWAIHQHIREIAPENINNLVRLIQLSTLLGKIEELDNYLLEIINLLTKENDDYTPELLLQLVPQLMSYAPEKDLVFNFVNTCLKYFPHTQIILDTVVSECIKISLFAKRPDLAVKFAEPCLQIQPHNKGLLLQISYFYQNSFQYAQGIEIAKRLYELVNSNAEKLAALGLVNRALMSTGSYWEETFENLQKQEQLVYQLISEPPLDIDRISNLTLYNSVYFFPYINDDPVKNHYLQNQVSRLAQANIIHHCQDNLTPDGWWLSVANREKILNKKNLKIGYISHCFKKHSVSWLCRWIFQHHNREKFQIHTYFLSDAEQIEPFTKHHFADQSYKFKQLSLTNPKKIWEEIVSDEIDILVDLDSITLDSSCEVMSIKTAPIQVTWLGWDASGLPSIDYFLADPYVLPESAQDYYQETIWRLPQTYLAVDGFEVNVPTLRREDFGIPSDAIIYLMNQKGYKRHPEHLHLQMRIVKKVPNSYLLIKGEADADLSRQFFETIATEEGVDFSRIRFLPPFPAEATHRANLAIADVVLDTFPYNGATTTMETLWMGIPMVTRVGEQFAARNSYTMMINAGITEGIAWTEEEYVEWGVRLGKDEKLREEISWKLTQGRKTAPLWNAKQFTRDLESAYEQMWQKYVDS